MENFKRIKRNGGFWSRDLERKALAQFNPNTLTITWDSVATRPLITGELWQQLGATLYLVHELTHAFTEAPREGIYGHIHMANAASSAAEMRKIDIRKSVGLDLPKRENYATASEYDDALSVYYGKVLGYACRGVKLKRTNAARLQR